MCFYVFLFNILNQNIETLSENIFAEIIFHQNFLSSENIHD